jgi:hypothetical protein
MRQSLSVNTSSEASPDIGGDSSDPLCQALVNPSYPSQLRQEAAIKCKDIVRKLATVTSMGIMSLPEGVAEVSLHCIPYFVCYMSSLSGQGGEDGSQIQW